MAIYGQYGHSELPDGHIGHIGHIGHMGSQGPGKAHILLLIPYWGAHMAILAILSSQGANMAILAILAILAPRGSQEPISRG